MSIFKAYDIRGKYPDEINEEISYKIGFATAQFIEGRTLAVAQDVRKSAPLVAKATINGILDAGFDVIDIGLATTPMLYFAVGKFGYSGGMMVTASHNPPEYIGFKICREFAIPIGEKNGLKNIKAMIKKIEAKSSNIGTITRKSILTDYKKHILSFIANIRKLRIVVDTANGTVGVFFNKIFEELPIEIIPLYFEPDGSFPNHEPNPLKDKNIRDVCRTVVKTKADLGVAFDGDGDRCIFIDERGRRIPSDIITILLAKEALSKYKGATVVYDLRSSWIVKEEIEKAGGVPVRERVGHAFIKQTMRGYNAILGGELSGHYYFREHFFCDSGLVAFTKILNYLASDTRKMSEIIKPYKRYFATGEINFFSKDKDGVIKKISKVFSNAKQDKLDGITVQYKDWWFNLRKSNTEPLLRLNLEAKSKELLKKTKKWLFKILGKPV